MLERLVLDQGNYTVMHFDPTFTGKDLFILDPPYQRGEVWTVEQKVALVYSLLRRIPAGALVINDRVAWRGDPSRPYAVVDGLQRIAAMRGFVTGEFAVPAAWFDGHVLATEDDPATGAALVRFPNLDGVGQSAFRHSPIALYTAQVASVEEEAALFMLLNAGGTAQEADVLARASAMAADPKAL